MERRDFLTRATAALGGAALGLAGGAGRVSAGVSGGVRAAAGGGGAEMLAGASSLGPWTTV